MSTLALLELLTELLRSTTTTAVEYAIVQVWSSLE
jgi:hypothetical protein